MRRRGPGYTLLEMLVVILIISILAGMILAAVVIVRQKAAKDRTTLWLTSIREAIERYQTDCRDYPQTDSTDALSGGEQLYTALRSRDKGGPYLSGDYSTCDEDRDGQLEFSDAWNKAFRYLHPRSYNRQNPNRYSFRLWSCGPDCRDQPLEPSSDDIRNWNKAAPDKADGD